VPPERTCGGDQPSSSGGGAPRDGVHRPGRRRGPPCRRGGHCRRLFGGARVGRVRARLQRLRADPADGL